MNVQDVSKLLPAVYTARKTTESAPRSEAAAPATQGMVDTYEASAPIESELPAPGSPASSATPEVLQRYVMDVLLRQYSQGNSYFKMLYEPSAVYETTVNAASSVTPDVLAAASDAADATQTQSPELLRAIELVGANGMLSPDVVSANIAEAALLMLNLNPSGTSGFQLSIQLAFSDFGQLFGGQLPPITQQTLMTFTTSYDPFRTDVHVSEADDPVLETTSSSPPENEV